MEKKIRPIIATAITILIIIAPFSYLYSAEKGNREFKARVKIETSIKETLDVVNVKDLVTNFLHNEFRSLDGVVLVEDHPQWIISIAVLPIDITQGLLGWTISVVIMRSLLDDPEHIRIFKEEYKDMGIFLSGHAVMVQDHLLSIADKGSLRSKCEEIIIFFDKNYLEPARTDFKW
ncbi:MAG: hypothetical protein MRJ65_15785 [Candidatus Brocadiaceae bacterium]|nr:hypothetical protein [Candidatus Brocadiaceae bacterium]